MTFEQYQHSLQRDAQRWQARHRSELHRRLFSPPVPEDEQTLRNVQAYWESIFGKQETWHGTSEKPAA
jgi:hypothetical protein